MLIRAQQKCEMMLVRHIFYFVKSLFPCLLTISLCMQPLSPSTTFPHVCLGISTVSAKVIAISQIIFVQWNSQFLNTLRFSFLFLQFLFRIFLLKKNTLTLLHGFRYVRTQSQFLPFQLLLIHLFFLKKWRNSVTNSHASTINLRSHSSIATVVPKKS